MTDLKPSATAETHVSIGAVSRATGIPADTLRTWERRYGFPTPIRTSTGHRLYPAAAIERLQLVAEALEHGHRVSHIVGLSVDQLQALLHIDGHDARAEPSAAPPRSPEGSAEEDAGDDLDEEPDTERWLEAVETLDEGRLRALMHHAWGRYGALGALESAISPFLWAIGSAWEEGRLRVSHEHFASECTREFLSAHWRALSEHNHGPAVILTTLPGEEHTLGLHMVACIFALAGLQLVFLGANTPLEDVVSSAIDAHASALALSVSFGVHTVMAQRHLTRLRALTPMDLHILVGGAGIQEAPPGVERLTSLEDALLWAQRLQEPPTPRSSGPRIY